MIEQLATYELVGGPFDGTKGLGTRLTDRQPEPFPRIAVWRCPGRAACSPVFAELARLAGFDVIALESCDSSHVCWINAEHEQIVLQTVARYRIVSLSWASEGDSAVARYVHDGVDDETYHFAMSGRVIAPSRREVVLYG